MMSHILLERDGRYSGLHWGYYVIKMCQALKDELYRVVIRLTFL